MNTNKLFGYSLIVLLFITPICSISQHDTLPKFDRTEMVKLVLENPRMINVIKNGGAFGGDWSRHVGANIFSKDHKKAIKDVKKLTEVDTVAKGVWHVRMPIVNFSVVETKDGLVMIDAGYGLVGDHLDELLTTLSNKPLIAVIYTHGHVDHAFGLWKIIEKYPDVEIIAHKNIIDRFNRYLKLNASLSKYMSQPISDMPKTKDFFQWPTKIFSDTLSLNLGEEIFNLYHYKGETDDQLFVHIPSKRMVFSADYYVGFFPNIGNGKRVQRYIEDWRDALLKMQKLKAEILVPSHGKPLFGNDTINYELSMLATTYELIISQTLERLNAQWRKDEVVDKISLPDSLTKHPTLKEVYTTYEDASKMLVKQYTGWYDDIPSNWNPATKKKQAQEFIFLAGGSEKMISRVNELMTKDIKMSCHLVDQLFVANPYNKETCELLIKVYKYRILNSTCHTQEILEYLRWMTIARLVKKEIN